MINLLFIADKFKNFLKLLKSLLEKENAKIFLPKIMVDREIIYKNQQEILQTMLNENIVELTEVEDDEIENTRRLYSFRLGLGEIAMSILVKKFLKSGKPSVGFTNEKFVVKKMKNEIPLLHGLWFYTQMFFYGIINQNELENIINEANKDMKVEIEELKNIKQEYLSKKVSLREIVNSFMIDKL